MTMTTTTDAPERLDENAPDGPAAGLVPEYRRPLWTALGRSGRARVPLAVALVGAVAEHGLAVVASGATGWAIGAAASGRAVGELTTAVVVVIVAVVGSAVGTWAVGQFGHAFAFRSQADLRLKIYDGLARSLPRAIGGRRSGDLASVAMGDIDTLELFFAHLGLAASVGAVVGIGTTIAVGLIHPVLALIGILGMLAVVVAPVLVGRLEARRAEALRAEVGTVNADVVDGVQGLRELLVFRRLDDWYQRIAEGTRGLRRHRLAHARATGLQDAVNDVLVAATVVVLLVAVVGLANAGAIGLPAGVMAIAVVIAALSAITTATEMAGGLAPLRASARRVLEIIDQPAAVADTGTAEVAVDRQRGDGVRFESVSFAYPGRPPAVAELDLDVPPGSTVAIVGRSGAGKTTCANLLLRFFDPDAGRVTIDGHDLRDIPLEHLPTLVTVVAQDVHLFAGSVADNLRLARPDASDADLRAAAQLARAHEFVADLPDGYDTEVGERGARLSGGQRQRLSIARALLADAPVLVLDEAASNLDTENERLVQQALDAARRGRTTIVIAHRLSTVRAADRIVVLDEGRVVEQGTHAELLAAGGAYTDLMHRQTTD